jgi:hypothetical protein
MLTLTCKSDAASRVHVAFLSFQELTAAEEEQEEEDKEKQHQVSEYVLYFTLYTRFIKLIF